MSEPKPYFNTLEKIREFLDDVSLGHSQSIYETNDYDGLKEVVLSELKVIFAKSEKLDEVLKKVGFWAGYQYEGQPELRSEIQQLTGEILSILNQEKRRT